MAFRPWNAWGLMQNEAMLDVRGAAGATNGMLASGYDWQWIDAAWNTTVNNTSTAYPSGISNVIGNLHALGLQGDGVCGVGWGGGERAGGHTGECVK